MRIEGIPFEQSDKRKKGHTLNRTKNAASSPPFPPFGELHFLPGQSVASSDASLPPSSPVFLPVSELSVSRQPVSRRSISLWLKAMHVQVKRRLPGHRRQYPLPPFILHPPRSRGASPPCLPVTALRRRRFNLETDRDTPSATAAGFWSGIDFIFVIRPTFSSTLGWRE